jgi:mono/diheme cytochrome c family protein
MALKIWLPVACFVILLGATLTARADNPPTYFQDVKPILDQHCQACHAPDGVGYSHYPMGVDFVPTAIEANDLVFAVDIRYMPPWLPDGDTPSMLHDRSLTEDEIATLFTWADAGAPMGDPAQILPTSTPAQSVLADSDEVLSPNAAYSPDAARNEDYRCFLLDPTDNTHITAYAVEPGTPEQVHHIVLYRVNADQRAEALSLDQQDTAEGWHCPSGIGIQTNDMPPLWGQNAIIGTWTPGMGIIEHPAGGGIPIASGDGIVMQIHYDISLETKPDTTRLHLHYADSPVTPLQTQIIYAPVEVPCPPENSAAECSREGLDAQIRVNADAILSTCGSENIDMASISAIVSSCDHFVEQNGLLVAVLGYMQERGTSIRVELNPGSGRTLLSIPRWDVDWFERYQFAEPILIQSGDVLRVTCTWDNARKRDQRYWVWDNSLEMCLAVLDIMPQ